MIPLLTHHENSSDVKNLTSFSGIYVSIFDQQKFPFGNRNKFKFCLFMNPITKCFTAANESCAARVMEYFGTIYWFLFSLFLSSVIIHRYVIFFIICSHFCSGTIAIWKFEKFICFFFSWKYVADIVFDRFSEIELIIITSVGVKSINDSAKTNSIR